MHFCRKRNFVWCDNFAKTKVNFRIYINKLFRINSRVDPPLKQKVKIPPLPTNFTKYTIQCQGYPSLYCTVQYICIYIIPPLPTNYTKYTMQCQCYPSLYCTVHISVSIYFHHFTPTVSNIPCSVKVILLYTILSFCIYIIPPLPTNYIKYRILYVLCTTV